MSLRGMMCVGLLKRNKFTTENDTFALPTGLCWSEVPKRSWRIILQCFRSLLCVCKLYIHSHSAARPLCFWNPTYLIPKTVPYITCVFMDVGSWRNVTMPTCLSHLPNPASPKDLYLIPVSWWFLIFMLLIYQNRNWPQMQNYAIIQKYEIDLIFQIVLSVFPGSSAVKTVSPVCSSSEDLYPHAESCAKYFDCSRTSRGGVPRSRECSYPYLFDSASGSCQYFTEVNCGSRPEPKHPCKL